MKLGELRRRIDGAHERRPDQDRIGSGELCRGALRARRDTALGHDHPGARRPCDELELRPPVDLEGGEIARVHPDGIGAERDGAAELLGVVRLHEGIQAELVRGVHERRRLRVVEVSKEEQDGVCTRGAQLDQLVGAREEALSEKRDRRNRARRGEV
jgi:hypothetical protein